MRKLHCYSDGQHSSALIMQRLNEMFMKYCTTDIMQAVTHVQRTWCEKEGKGEQATPSTVDQDTLLSFFAMGGGGVDVLDPPAFW